MNSACLEINFIKICPEIASKYIFEKMWFYMKYIVKNGGWRILMSMYCTSFFSLALPKLLLVSVYWTTANVKPCSK